MTHYYTAYGLYWRVNVPISSFIPIEPSQVVVESNLENHSAWVDVDLGHFPQNFEPNQVFAKPADYVSPYLSAQGQPDLRLWVLENYFFLTLEDGVDFLLDSSGRKIWAKWETTYSLEYVLTYLVGIIAGFLLHLRGTTCLHASAVRIEDQALLFVGHSGAGKSTTAAMLAQHGFPIIADDIVALLEQSGQFWVQPAYPRLRLWQPSVAALFGNANALPQLLPEAPDWNKQYLDLSQPGYQFDNQPVKIGAIYLLMGRQSQPRAPFTLALPAAQQLIELVARSYGTRLITTAQRGKEFEVLGRLIQTVTVKQLVPHPDLACLPQLLATLLADIHAES